MLEIVNAWYGTEGYHQDNGGQVQNRLRMAVQQSGGQGIHMPGDFNREFGFDPCPGTRKELAVHVRVNGQDHHLRFPEGQAVNWNAPFGGGGYPPQQGYGGGFGGGVEIVNAWYGTEGYHQDNGGQVQNRLRMAVQQSGGQGIHMPGDFNREFGFDPCPGTRKELAVHVRVNGQEHHLRFPEGQAVNWNAPQGFPQQGFPPQQQGYPQQGYGMPQQGYPPQGMGYPPQQGFGGGYGGVEIVNAWYGTEGYHQDNGGQVQNRLRMAVQQSGGQALRMPGDFNREFGFDPLPGTHKVLAVHLRHNGQDHHLRFQEGENVDWFPGCGHHERHRAPPGWF